MFHLRMKLRSHRAPLHPDGLHHEWPAETVAEAIEIAKEKMRDNYADPVELQNEDRTRNEELTAQLLAGARS